VVMSPGVTTRAPSFTAGSITSFAGLVLAFNPEFWSGSLNPVGQAGLALVVVGAVIAVIGAAEPNARQTNARGGSRADPAGSGIRVRRAPLCEAH